MLVERELMHIVEKCILRSIDEQLLSLHLLQYPSLVMPAPNRRQDREDTITSETHLLF
jgi:hypothetical protein